MSRHGVTIQAPACRDERRGTGTGAFPGKGCWGGIRLDSGFLASSEEVAPLDMRSEERRRAVVCCAGLGLTGFRAAEPALRRPTVKRACALNVSVRPAPRVGTCIVC